MRPRGTQPQREQRRFQAIALLEKGMAQVDIARKLGIQDRSVRRWIWAYRRYGKPGLKLRKMPGRAPKLDARSRKQLGGLLLRGARAAGFPTELWTCPRVSKVINRQFGVSYHEDHIGRVLRSMGWSPQKPEKLARERDEKAIRRWVKVDWPQIKKKPAP